MSAKSSLNRNQKKALQALMEHKTMAAAAQSCGLSEKTLQRYLADPIFRREIGQVEGDLIDEAGRVLVSGQMAALKTLADLMQKGRSETVRRGAAKDWMEFVFKWRELRTVEDRLESLEKAVFNEQRK